MKYFSLFVTHNSDSFIFGNGPFGEIKDHSLRARYYQKTFAMQVLGMCLSYEKSGFQEHQWSAFLFMAQLTQILFVFRSLAFGDIKDHSLRTTLFQQKNLYGGFEIVSTLCEKVFSRAPLKWFSLNGSHYSDSLVFRNAGFWEIKDHSLKKTHFPKRKLLLKF